MATFEEYMVAQQLRNYVSNGTVNWRNEAARYKAAAAVVGADLVLIATQMRQDAAQHERLMNKITAIAARNLPVLDAALATMGITRAAAIALKNTIVATAQHTQIANLITVADINAEVDFILAALPNYESVK